jgi:hypothetical protein
MINREINKRIHKINIFRCFFHLNNLKKEIFIQLNWNNLTDEIFSHSKVHHLDLVPLEGGIKQSLALFYPYSLKA